MNSQGTAKSVAVDAATFDALRALDTPTVCNALEMLESGRRSYGFTTEQLFCLRPEMPAIVGFAKTATVRSLRPSRESGDEVIMHRASYYRYVGDGPLPKVCVMQDLDGVNAGYGAFWGTFNSSIHRALGCEGVITDGAIRDIQKIPVGFQMIARAVRPSHAFVHIVDFGITVNVCSMVVCDGDLIHADVHGAVCFPPTLVGAVLAAAKDFIESERPIIEACAMPDITIDQVLEIYTRRVSR